MTAVMALRERQKEAFKKQHGVGLGIASFFVKASGRRAARVPAAQRRDPGRRDRLQALLRHRHGGRRRRRPGRAGPARRRPHVVRRHRAGDPRLRRARQDGTLTLEDLTGGTFTITNGGVFGSLLSTPILNPPQVGILGLHKIQDRPVAVNGQVVIRPMMYVALVYDHRIVDGREAVQFLVKIKEFIEDPGHLLLES